MQSDRHDGENGLSNRFPPKGRRLVRAGLQRLKQLGRWTEQLKFQFKRQQLKFQFKRQQLKQLGLSLLLCVPFGCDDSNSPNPPETRCGSGPVKIELGTGNPFAPTPAHIFMMEAGLQGGHHVEISLRLQGAIDPDSVDIELRLRGATWQISTHQQTDWLLHLGADGASCEYPLARLVMLDERGGLLDPNRFEEITEAPVRLDISVQSSQGDGRANFEVTLAPPGSS